jgi:hypothetical protein
LVLGSGVSAQSQTDTGVRPKTWAAFLSAAAMRLPASRVQRAANKLIKEGDLLTACEVIKGELSASDFTDLVIAEFLTPKYRPAPIHDVLIRLDSRIVATPNFDKIFEVRINEIQHASVRVKTYSDDDVAECLRRPERVVIKMHGTIDTPGKMIFSRIEYARARAAHRPFYELLAALAATHTFLFVGCGLGDPDVRLLLEDYAFRHPVGSPHYLVTHSKASYRPIMSTLSASLGLEFLEYSYTDDHKHLVDDLGNLAGLVEAERATLADSGDW